MCIRPDLIRTGWALSPVLVMPIDTVDTLVHTLGRFRLLEPAQYEELTRLLQSNYTEPLTLSKELVLRGWLTPYQVSQLFQAQDRQLVLGPYILLEKISEGVMGDVFKARHQHMKRIVALQVIRADLLRNPEAVERFYQEVQAASQLSHPHLVASYDAGPVGNTHFFAMEYVEGIDLDRKVQQEGPLPVLQACEFIRQAALGLQHAYQRGLRHHDLKPANLLLTDPRGGGSDGSTSVSSSVGALAWGMVKVRNLGLTVIRQPTKHTRLDPTRPRESTGFSTPDYVAPERIATGQTGDIRADVYSLGCTFYFLLAGQVPFPGGTAEEKQRRHLEEQPEPIGGSRSGVAAEVEAIVTRAMAKDPAERFETPAEVAAALASLPAHVLAASATDDVGRAWQRRREAERRRFRRLVQIGGGALAVGLLFFGVLLYKQMGPSTPTEVARHSAPAGRPFLAKQPALVVHCGRTDGWPNVEVTTPGYGIKLLQGGAGGGWDTPLGKKFCWYDGTEVRFAVQLPPNTAGELRLLMVDGDNTSRKERLLVQGRKIRDLEAFAGEGQTVNVPVSVLDPKDGKIEVGVVKLAGANAVISGVEFYPQVLQESHPDPSRPALAIHCGRGRGLEQEEVMTKGYTYRLHQGQVYDEGPPVNPKRFQCWVHDHELRIELRVPAGVAGTVRTTFFDLPTKQPPRKQRVLVQGKPAGDLADFTGAGKHLDTKVSALDTKDGKIDIVVQKLEGSGNNATISRIEFFPQPK
jgi:serine/threonine protein kinase